MFDYLLMLHNVYLCQFQYAIDNYCIILNLLIFKDIEDLVLVTLIALTNAMAASMTIYNKKWEMNKFSYSKTHPKNCRILFVFKEKWDFSPKFCILF